jgi:hypothetical protein
MTQKNPGLLKRPAPGRHLGFTFDRPNGRGFIALLEAFRATGGTAPGEIVARLLEEHQGGHDGGRAGSLAKQIYTGQVFGFEWRAKLWIPMFQFGADDLALKPGVQRVRAELASLGSGWAVASWFAEPNPQLDGRSPVDRVDLDFDAVMRAAQSLQRTDVFAPSRVRQRTDADTAAITHLRMTVARSPNHDLPG